MVDPTWSRRRFLASAAGATGVVVAGGTLAACGLQNGSSTDAEVGKSDSGWGGTLVSPPLAMPDVTFTTDKGEPYPLRESTKGKLTMLFFGYTNCPNQCPVYLNTVARARAAIGSGPGSVLTVLFVGIDLKRDTPTALRTYLNNIDSTFVGLTGTQDVIDKASSDLHFAPPVIATPDKNGNYYVGHTAQAVAYTPDNLGHRLYGYDVRREELVHDLPRMAKGAFS
jgi:protein SCO1/2